LANFILANLLIPGYSSKLTNIILVDLLS